MTMRVHYILNLNIKHPKNYTVTLCYLFSDKLHYFPVLQRLVCLLQEILQK